MNYVISEKDIEFIKLYPHDKDYKIFRKFKNAEIVNADTDEEFIVFYTLNKNKLKKQSAS